MATAESNIAQSNVPCSQIVSYEAGMVRINAFYCISPLASCLWEKQIFHLIEIAYLMGVNSVLSAQFHCEPKAALTNKVY